MLFFGYFLTKTFLLFFFFLFKSESHLQEKRSAGFTKKGLFTFLRRGVKFIQKCTAAFLEHFPKREKCTLRNICSIIW